MYGESINVQQPGWSSSNEKSGLMIERKARHTMEHDAPGRFLEAPQRIIHPANDRRALLLVSSPALITFH